MSIVGLKMNPVLIFGLLLSIQTCLEFVSGGEPQVDSDIFWQEEAREPLSTAESFSLCTVLLSSTSCFCVYISFTACILGVWIVFCEGRYAGLKSLWIKKDLNLNFPLQINALGIKLDR